MKRTLLMALAAVLVGAAHAQVSGAAPEAKDMAQIGFDDLQGRSAYQPLVREQNGRWILYVGHHGGTDSAPKPLNPVTGAREFNGTSIIDVTDPRAPRYLAHIPGEEGLGEAGGAQMVRVCAGRELPHGDPAKFYLLRPFGNSAHEVWDVTDPAKPVLVTRIGPVAGTHKNWWECDSGIAYLVSGVPGWRTRRMTQVYDLSDPAKPRFIRNFGLPGQQPGGTGDAPVELHGPISTGPKGNRVYFGYGTNKDGIVQIVDRGEAARRAAGAHAVQSRVPGSRPVDAAAQRRRAHGVPAARDGDRRIRARQERADARFSRRRRRVAGQRVRGGAADAVDRRHHDRVASVRRRELHGA